MQPRTGFRFSVFIAFAVFAVTGSAHSAEAQPQGKNAQAKNAATNPANPKIRAITAFLSTVAFSRA